jgi:hypothetical protein
MGSGNPFSPATFIDAAKAPCSEAPGDLYPPLLIIKMGTFALDVRYRRPTCFPKSLQVNVIHFKKFKGNSLSTPLSHGQIVSKPIFLL